MKDFDIRFNLHPLTGDIVVKKDEDAIRQSLRSIIMHIPGERRLAYKFGVGINTALFELLDIFSAEFLRKKIMSEIIQYETRINLLDVQLIQVKEENFLYIQITYNYKNGGQVSKYNLKLERLG